MPQTVRVNGARQLQRRLRRFNPKRQRALYRKTLNQSTTPLKSALRTEVRVKGAVRKGHLRKAVSSKVKTYPSGITVLLVGFKNKRLGDGENPGKYSHLVDLGTKPHFQPEAYRFAGNRIIGPGWNHPGAAARDIMKPALRKGGPKMQAQFFKRAEINIERELA